MPSVQATRGFAVALVTRAMQRVEAGQYPEAWQDLLAVRRLGRLLGQSATLIELLVGYAIDQVAQVGCLAYLDTVPLTAGQLRQHLADLQTLPAWPTVAQRLQLGERCLMLDFLQIVRRRGFVAIDQILDTKLFLPPFATTSRLTPQQQQWLAQIDWESTLIKANQWYDRVVMQ